MKMWSGRFQGPLDPHFEQWQRSFPFDCRLLPEELACSRVHARALAGAGILSPQELEAVLEGLERIAKNAASDPAFLDDADAEDVHHFVEKSLVALIGETGNKLHAGRSRNEQIATDLRLFVRARLDDLRRLLADLIAALLEQAEKAGTAIMPAYTHLQRAEPVLVAHWLLAYAEMFLRDSERLADCRKRANRCPMGSGAVAGANLPLDRATMAAELDFDGPTGNSMDATSDRDFALEFLQALSQLGLHLSRWGEEMVIFSSAEYGFVRLPESHATGSSAMPQKKNPDAAELIRGKAGAIIGQATAVAVTLKGLPLAYNKDLQETQQPVFLASDTALSLLKIATGFLREVQFDYGRMHAAASSGFTNATAAATYLTQHGVPFRRAHELIGKLIQACTAKGCELADLSFSDLRQVWPDVGHDFYSRIAPEAVVASHDVPGGTAPTRVRQALAAWRSRLTALRGEAHARA